MDKQKVNVPGAEEFAQPRSRKNFFKALAVAGAGAAAGSLAFSREASAQAGGDLEIANFALTLEYLEEEYYGLALDAGVLSGDALAVVEALFDHESQHVGALVDLIGQFGGTPVAKPEFAFPPETLASQGAILETAATLEPVGVGAYLGAAVLIKSPEVLAAAGSIAGVEGEHVVAVNNLIGGLPAAVEAFPAALTMDEVLAAVSPFIVGGMMDTGGEDYRSRGSFGRV